MRDDSAFEPIKGLPDRPPEGERVLWQGAPSWRVVARRVFRIRWIAAYFALAIIWQFAAAVNDGAPISNAIGASAVLVGFAVGAIGLFILIAIAVERTTVYTITSKRLVFRVGMALPMTINVPFKVVRNAGLKAFKDGTGDIAIALDAETRIPYFALWPHTRPWRFSRPEPMIRCIENPENAAAIIAQAYKVEADGRALSKDNGTRSSVSTHAPAEQVA